MTDQKSSGDCSNESMRRDEQGITQEKPSHMNQGNQTFRPDQQKSQSPSDRRGDQRGGQENEERPRKAS